MKQKTQKMVSGLLLGCMFLQFVPTTAWAINDFPNNRESVSSETTDSTTSQTAQTDLMEMPFHFSGQLAKHDVEATCFYSDDYFLKDAREYDPQLATMSLCFELTTWSRYEGTWGKDVTMSDPKFKNARDLLVGNSNDAEDHGLGFDHFAVNDFWESRPTKDSIGAVAAGKTLSDGSTLIALGIRGGGYEQEWASNFTVGEAGDHDGFAEARQNVLNFLAGYIDEQNITGSVKLWIVGYSRAGVTANMVAGAIDDGYKLPHVTIEPQNLFTYTFEAPQGAMRNEMSQTSDADGYAAYSNIHNVINLNDFVPLVAPSVWNFARYNIDEFIPNAYNDSEKYAKYSPTMKSFYTSFDGDTSYNIKEYSTQYNIKVDWRKILPGGDPFLSLVPYDVPTEQVLMNSANYLFGKVVGSRQYYYDHLQSDLRELFSLLNGGSIPNSAGKGISLGDFCIHFFGKLTWEKLWEIVKPAIAVNFDSLETRKNKIKDRLHDFVVTVLGDEDLWEGMTFVADSGDTLTTLLWNLIESAVEDVIHNGSGSLKSFYNLLTSLKGVGQAHYPEITLAWMMAQDINYNPNAQDLQLIGNGIESETRSETGAGNGYQEIHINCSPINCLVDVSVYDGSTLVAAISQEKRQEIEGSSIRAYIDEDGEKIIVLPGTGDYTIRLKAADDGEVYYSVNEFSFDTMSTVRVLNFEPVSVSAGDELVGHVPSFSNEELDDGISTGSAAPYTLQDQYNQTVSCALKNDLLPTKEYIVTTVSGDYGSVVGGGSYPEGNFAKVSAYPYHGSKFLGWYSDGEQVSTDESYRFPVYADTTLEARFAEVETYTLTVLAAQGGSVENEQIKVPAGVEVSVVALAEDGYRFAGWTATNGTFENTDSSDTWFTMPASDVTITANFSQEADLLLMTSGNSNSITDSINFFDVSPDSYYHDAVLWAVEKGVTTGTDVNIFSPDLPCTRAQMVTFLWRAAGSPSPTNTDSPFTDVHADAYYYDAMLWAVEKGIAFGTSVDTFSPDVRVTQGQAVTFLYRYAVFSTANENIDSEKYNADAVKWATDAGLISGTNATTFRPDDDCSRAQLVTLLYRYEA